jgi:hypothetical protein
MNQSQRILSDGSARHRRAVALQIRLDVEREYEDQLAQASFIKRLKLRWLMRQEIARRMPSPKSLYGMGQ